MFESKWMDIGSAPNDEAVIVYDPDDSRTSYPKVYLATKNGNEWWRMNGDEGYFCKPTHWQPLPAPPENVKANKT